MGAINIGIVFMKYAGKVPPKSLNVLVYMALVSLDKDKWPWFGLGHTALAEHALGRKPPITKSDLRAVERAVSPLLGYAITVDRKAAAARTDGPNTVRYRLNLQLGTHSRRKLSDVNDAEDPSLPTKTVGREPSPEITHSRHFPVLTPDEKRSHSRRKTVSLPTKTVGLRNTRRHEEINDDSSVATQSRPTSSPSEEEVNSVRAELGVTRAREPDEDPPNSAEEDQDRNSEATADGDPLTELFPTANKKPAPMQTRYRDDPVAAAMAAQAARRAAHAAHLAALNSESEATAGETP